MRSPARRRAPSLLHDERAVAWLFLAPALAALAIFLVVPFMMAVGTSLADMHLLRPGEARWAGLRHYADLGRDPLFRRAAWNTILFVVAVVPAQTGLALALALLVNQRFAAARAMRLAIFSPVMTSMAVLSIVWALLYHPHGPLNGALGALGLPAQPFLESPRQALPSIMLMSVWQGVGFQMMIFLAGLQSIPPTLYDAARVDGARAWQRFRHVTLPMLRETTIFVLAITSILGFKLFVQPFIMTQGGPEGSTMTLILHLFDSGFTAGNVGRGSAIAVLFFLLVLGVTLALLGLTGGDHGGERGGDG